MFEAVKALLLALIAGAVGYGTTVTAGAIKGLDAPNVGQAGDPAIRSDLAPIFRCSGAGGQVVVSLGGDGDSIFVSCTEVKP